MNLSQHAVTLSRIPTIYAPLTLLTVCAQTQIVGSLFPNHRFLYHPRPEEWFPLALPKRPKVKANLACSPHPKRNSHIWLLWNNVIDVNIVDHSDQYITAKITHNSKSFFLSTVYASCDINRRKLLWHDLSIFYPGPLPWLIGGDFNTISKPSEKCGGRPYSNKSMDHFNSFIASSSLLEVSHLGDQYTWCNNNTGPTRIWLRLDKLLTNLAGSLAFPNLKVVHKPRILCDHCPIVAINHEPTRFPRNFKFLRQWTQDEDFSNVMTRSWALNTEGPPLVTLHKKLLRCKSAFSSLQKQKKRISTIKSWELPFKSSTLRSSSNQLSTRIPFVISTMPNSCSLLC
ncbi:Exo_endo_phos domain-containing protein [Cephalotus follicularis]|uniref:Exo_endo_phos domain-containing protein n=1 Tax=Cephalotus follicularis TaxID=3775 RepID=A0A1Q3D795_CEPFO|nr:Exo_endo_phos domain-containing protein [Cephalotus follicularis]